MSNNMKDRFVSSNFDEVDMVLDTDRRFDEAIAAADAGEYDLITAIVNDLHESGTIKTAIEEDDVIEYNPEDDDATGILDCTAEEVREYVSDGEYDDEDGELIDSIVAGNAPSDDDDFDDEDEEDNDIIDRVSNGEILYDDLLDDYDE